MAGSITDVPGVKVGHAHDASSLTGCTVILCEEGAVGGVDVRGGAPGARDLEPLRSPRLVERVHAIVLTGGSAFGLAACDGVMRYLEERGVGFEVGVTKVPIVAGAVIFDLWLGDPRRRPDAEMGYRACESASAVERRRGNVGAGMGATVGKLYGPKSAMKAGLGMASVKLSCGATVGALAVVNAFGDVIEPGTGRILAGSRRPGTTKILDTARALLEGERPPGFVAGANTTLVVVATNAKLTKEGAIKLAQLANAGMAKALSPAHTMLDGDLAFCLSTGEAEADLLALGAAVERVVPEAIVDAVKSAEGVEGVPAWRDLFGGG